MLEITFLGTGTSNGIPVIGCDCDVCRSTDPRDRRTRTSALVRYDEHSLLIDTATELRTQALANDVRRVDAVLMTHAHADHTGSLDALGEALREAEVLITACEDRFLGGEIVLDPEEPGELRGSWGTAKTRLTRGVA